MSRKTYTLKEVAERTGASLETVQEAVRAGNLALTQTSDQEEPRVTQIDLERWQGGTESHDAERLATDRAHSDDED